MSLTRLWVFSAVAPWCLATGLLVSFAADAGQDSAVGFTVREYSRAAAPQDLVPSTGLLVFDSLHRQASASGDLVSPASFEIGSPAELSELPDEVQPRMDLKREARNFPTVDRARKGNLYIGLRPSYESKRTPPRGEIGEMRRAAAVFGQDERNPPAAVLLPGDGDPPGPEAVAAFEGAVIDPTTTAKTSALASPQAGAGVTTARQAVALAASAADRAQPAAVTVRANDGSSPIVPRAVGLASVTPTARNSTPVAVDALLRLPATAGDAKSRPGAPAMSIVASSSGIIRHPDYLSLISADKMKSESQCLAEAIYFEARSEPDAGQAAVAQVVLNRVASGLYPSSICGVVYQNRQHYLGCQFSFACEGKSLRVTEPAAWSTAQRIARQVLDGETYVAKVGDATHYHARYVRPYWASSLTRTDAIGQHVFYKMR